MCAWHVELVLFMSKAFQDGTINTQIKTLAQLQSLVSQGEVFIIDTPISFNCAHWFRNTHTSTGRRK